LELVFLEDVSALLVAVELLVCPESLEGFPLEVVLSAEF
jgi:hypothetical protein